MDEATIEHIEIKLFLEAVVERYGYDFRNYARPSVVRRLRQLAQSAGFHRISEMIPCILHDASFLSKLVQNLSIGVTEMFRDPPFWFILRNEIIPILKTYPSVRIWHAGCSSGEEVYSLVIVLKEEGLLDRTTVFATDFNTFALENAKKSLYDLDLIRGYAVNYEQSGGKKSFSEYYSEDHDVAVMDKSLQRNITFAPHNLAIDNSFGEMHLILCRNVLIYFNSKLQHRVLNLFDESLVNGGFFALGSRERLSFPAMTTHYEVIDSKWRVYKKKSNLHTMRPLQF